MVFATCRRILGQEGAEDATQEVFFKLAKRAETVHGNVGGWLHTCATNHCLTVRRSGLRQQQRDLAYEQQKKYTEPHAAEASWDEVAPHLDTALEQLPEPTRYLLVEHFLQRRTQTELAAEEGVSVGTISRRIEKALENLRSRLKQEGFAISPLFIVGIFQNDALLKLPQALLAGAGKIAMGGAALKTGGVGGGVGGNLVKYKWGWKLWGLGTGSVVGVGVIVILWLFWPGRLGGENGGGMRVMPEVKNNAVVAEVRLPVPDIYHLQTIRMVWQEQTAAMDGTYQEQLYDSTRGVVEYRKQQNRQEFLVDTGTLALRYINTGETIRLVTPTFQKNQVPEDMRKYLTEPAGGLVQRIVGEDQQVQSEKWLAYQSQVSVSGEKATQYWVDQTGLLRRMLTPQNGRLMELTVEYNQDLGPIYEQSQEMIKQINK